MFCIGILRVKNINKTFKDHFELCPWCWNIVCYIDWEREIIFMRGRCIITTNLYLAFIQTELIQRKYGKDNRWATVKNNFRHLETEDRRRWTWRALMTPARCYGDISPAHRLWVNLITLSESKQLIVTLPFPESTQPPLLENRKTMIITIYIITKWKYKQATVRLQFIQVEL